MKVLLFAILDRNEETETLMRRLSKEGYNGTVIPSEGLHHILPTFSDGKKAIALSAMVEDLPHGEFSLFVMIDEEKLEPLQRLIREATGSFKKAKGGMIVLPVASYEGSF